MLQYPLKNAVVTTAFPRIQILNYFFDVFPVCWRKHHRLHVASVKLRFKCSISLYLNFLPKVWDHANKAFMKWIGNLLVMVNKCIVNVNCPFMDSCDSFLLSYLLISTFVSDCLKYFQICSHDRFFSKSSLDSLIYLYFSHDPFFGFSGHF